MSSLRPRFISIAIAKSGLPLVIKATSPGTITRAKLCRMASLFLIGCLLATSTPGSPGMIEEFAGRVRLGLQTPANGLVSWLKTRALPQRQNRGMPPAPVNLPGVTPPAPPTRTDREARVASLQINSADDVTLESRQRMLFSATPLDNEGAPIHGLHVEWESSNRQVIFVSRSGQAIAGRPGTAILMATAGNARRNVQVTVIQGNADEFGGRPKADSTRGNSGIVSKNLGPGSRKQITRRHHALKKGSTAPMPLWDPSEDPLPDDETYSLYLASNAVGSPPGKKRGGALTPATATNGTEMGAQNFTFGLPVFSSPGRGIDASLSLTYNSQVWNKSVSPGTNWTWVSYNVDSGWPAPGFRLGFGQIENQGSFGMTLVDADGTRHGLESSGGNNYDTTDGTFLHYYGSIGSGTLYYPDGTQVTFGAAGGYTHRGFPTKITDANGNYLLISYVNGLGPKIDSIEDTLGRYVHFYYASNGDLVTITAPGLTGQSDRQVMRFYYDDVTIPSSGLFDSSIHVGYTGGGTLHTLKYIYLPSATESGSETWNAKIGYRFDYSCYGMMYQIKQFRGMTVSSTSTSSAGTVNEGTQAAITTYNYPTTASNLSDVPTYTTRTDDWAGRTTSVGGNPPSYTFANSTGTGEKISTVTAPDGTIVETHSVDSSGAWNDGLVKETIVKYSSTTLSDTLIDWEQTPSNGPPRIVDMKVTSGGITKATVFSYTSYNNVSAVSERDFTSDGSISTTELRRTETTYIASSNYTNRHLLRLPSMIKVFPGGSSTPSARVDYAYDDYGTSHANLTARNDIIMHDPAFDPFQQTQQINCHWACVDYEPGHGCVTWEWVCTEYNPYNPTTDYRGNVTSVTTYPDANSSSGTITHATTYDIAGNVMTTQVDCCQLKSFTYSGGGSGAAHDYAYPISVTSGSGGTTLTTSATYDYNTGLVATTTDENSQVTSFAYSSVSLRPATTTLPNGVQILYFYGDAFYADSSGKNHYYLSTKSWLDSSHYLESYRFYDGRGAVAATYDNWTSANGWSAQDIEYDVMGRAYRVGNPYYCGGYAWVPINPDGFWTTRTFDHLGRVTQITMPRGDNDNSLTTSLQASYDGIYTTFTDQAGKVQRQKVDALDRVVRLDEPTTSGLGTTTSPNQATNYTYDVLDNLVRVNQGSQDRYFKYDSLSRMIRERQVEQDTNSNYNLSDPITGNSSWTQKIDYNSGGLVTDAYDARGVHTTVSYDGLNRVTQINYSDSTPTAHYYYDSQTLPSGAPSTSSPDNYSRGYSAGRLVAMTYGSGATGNYFGYDNMGRVNMQFQLTGSTPTKYKLTYGYNYLGGLTSETYPSGRALSYAYDEGGRLSSVGDGTTTFANSFQYAPHGGLASETFGNTAVHTMSYNRRLQPSQAKLTLGSSVLQQYDYGYGEFNTSSDAVDTSKNNGQIGRITSTIGTSTQWLQGFQYDELGRLKNVAEYQSGSMSSQTYSQGYTYDRYGNRFQSANSTLGLPAVSSSEINAATNRFINSGSTPTTYDAAGNITTDTKFRGMNYSYDANSRMTFVETTAHANQQTSVYDCAGQRVKTAVGSATRTMVYDIFGQDVADYSGSSGTTLERENIYRGGQMLATYEAGSTALKYVLTDIQGSTRAIMNNSGGSSSVIARHDYLPFGEEISSGVGLRTSGQGYGAADTNRWKYGLTERDDTTGLDHTWWRKYESLSGRWTSPDPYNGSMRVGRPQSFNRYNYVDNDPVNLIDPWGLQGPEDPPPGGWPTDPSDYEHLSFYTWAPFYYSFEGLLGRLNFRPIREYERTTREDPGNLPPRKPAKNQESKEACIARVLARYLGRQALTGLKQLAIQTGVGLGVAFAVFFGGEFAAATVEGGILAGTFAQLHTLGEAVTFASGAVYVAGKYGVNNYKNYFRNTAAAASELKKCDGLP